MPYSFAASILIIFIINSCCATNTSSNIKDNFYGYKEIAESRLGPKSIIIFNGDSSFFMAANAVKNPGENLNRPLKFFIYDTKEGEIVFEDNLPGGTAEWISRYRVKVSTVPGIVSEKKEGEKKTLYGYIFDVKERRKINRDAELREQ